MYAIIEHAGKQFRVEKGQEIKVPFTEGEAGGNLKIDSVLLISDGEDTIIGKPEVAGAAVDATILGHGRDRKILVFHFRRRKGYQKLNGHRQDYTTLRINDIKKTGKASAKPAAAEAGAAPKKAEAKKVAPKTAAPKKTAPKKAAKAADAKAPAKKTAAKKSTTAKKAAPKKSGSTAK